MYAIIQSGGKQYRVEKGTKLEVELLPLEAGSDIEIAEVLVVGGQEGSAKIGQPYVAGSKVLAKITKHLRAPKVIIFKKRSKKGYKKIQGHRQNMTQIEIQDIKV